MEAYITVRYMFFYKTEKGHLAMSLHMQNISVVLTHAYYNQKQKYVGAYEAVLQAHIVAHFLRNSNLKVLHYYTHHLPKTMQRQNYIKKLIRHAGTIK